jgi:hypothetical protein
MRTGDDGTAAVLRIRPSPAALPAVLVLTLCVIPLGTAAGWLFGLFAVPALALAWVLRAGVDVDPTGITVRALLGRRRIDWSAVAGLRAGDRGDLWLVLDGGRRLRLPTARARHLPLIAAASGGRLADPLPAPTGRPATGQPATGQPEPGHPEPRRQAAPTGQPATRPPATGQPEPGQPAASGGQPAEPGQPAAQ